jgi:hypothetical protein
MSPKTLIYVPTLKKYIIFENEKIRKIRKIKKYIKIWGHKTVKWGGRIFLQNSRKPH